MLDTNNTNKGNKMKKTENKKPKWGKNPKSKKSRVVRLDHPAKKTPDEMAEDGKLAYILLDSGQSMESVINIIGSKKYIRKCVLYWIVSGDSNIYKDSEVVR